MPNTQKLSIRLLREGLTPNDSVRDGVVLVNWQRIPNSMISLHTVGGTVPKWASFLDLTDEQQADLRNSTAYGLVFIQATGRWFALSFGMGHVKLDPAMVQQDFGLRVVLNAVDPKQLKSADIRTPDENTLSRRSQTSRGSDQTAFAIDVERDIVRGLAGIPKNTSFASRVAGTDALTVDRRMVVEDLPAVCSEVYAMYQRTEYKNYFGWIDQIRHVRDEATIERLDDFVVEALNQTVMGNPVDGLHLAFPVIYDPEQSTPLRYKGFNSRNLYSDLDLAGYIDALKERGKNNYSLHDLKSHSVHEVDDHGRDCGRSWRIRECLSYDTSLDGRAYVLSGDRWYQIDIELAREVQGFFDRIAQVNLPTAEADENEEDYNSRVAKLGAGLLCLDRKLIKPTGATSEIEICDFLSVNRQFIHVKDKTSSSRLSHLFNQGTVAARVLIVDAAARDRVREKIREREAESGESDYLALLPSSTEDFRAADFTVVYGVLAAGADPKLPFFSLVSFRQAARELQALGYKCAFAWIQKPAAKPAVKAKRSLKA